MLRVKKVMMKLDFPILADESIRCLRYNETVASKRKGTLRWDMMKFRKRSVLWNWGWSYILILLIPLATNLINYRMNINTMKEELVRVNELTFDNATDSIDGYLELMKETYIYVYLNDSFGELQLKMNKDPVFYRNVAEVQGALGNYRNGVKEMFSLIYLEDKDYVVTSENSCPSEDYYRAMKLTHKDFMGYEEWKTLLCADYATEWLVEKGINFWTKEESLIYVNTIKSSWRGTSSILVSIPLTVIENATQYMKEDAWLLLKIEGMEPLVFHNGKLAKAPEWVAQEEFFVRQNKKSVSQDISYELVFSEESIMGELEGVRNTFLLNMTITLIFGIAGIVLLLRVNYRPIRSIMSEVEESITEQNEFEKLKKVYLQMKQEKQSSQKQMEKQKTELMNAMFLTMMKGRSVKRYEEEYKEYWGISLNHKVALVGFMLPIRSSNVEYDELNFFVVDNIFSELMEDEKFYHVEDGSFIFYLFDLAPDMEEEWRQKALEKAEFLRSLIEEKFKLSVIGVVSDIGEGIDGIKYLYQSVMEAFEHGKVVGALSVIDVRTLPNYDEFYLLEEWMDKEFREAFAEQDEIRASEIVDKVFTPQKKNAVDLATAKILAYKAFIIVMDIFRKHVTDVAQQEMAISYLEPLTKADGIEKIKDHFNQLLQFQIQAVSRQERYESKGILAEVIRYVEENYADYNLNLNTVADAIGKNSRHISRVFKEETKMGILDYINSIRIKKARELMASRKYTIEEVARQVGYNSVRTFRRAFVKITGEMPGAYME